MWGKFVAEFRAAPIPKEWKGHGPCPAPATSPTTSSAARTTPARRGQRAAEADGQGRVQDLPRLLGQVPVLRRVLAARARSGSSKNYGAEYHLIDEFRGAPSRVNSGLSEQAQPLNLDGTVFVAEPPPPPGRTRRPTADAEEKAADKPDEQAGAARRKEKSALDRRRRGSEGAAMKTSTMITARRPPGRAAVGLRRCRRGAAKGRRPPAGPAGQQVGNAGLGGGGEQVQRRRSRRSSQHDKANDWNDATCIERRAALPRRGQGAGRQGSFNEAIYNAGLANQRCKKDTEAQGAVQAGPRQGPEVPPRRVQLALYAFAESGEKDIDAGDRRAPPGRRRRRAVQERRGAGRPRHALHQAQQQDRRTRTARTISRAPRSFIQSALALDDGYMPAFNQLAVLYLETAKQAAGRDTKRKIGEPRRKEKKVDTAGARARGAGVLAGHPQEPEVRRRSTTPPA